MPSSLNIGSLIGSNVAIADKPHRVNVLNPDGPPVPDSGEYLQPYKITGYAYAAIEPATPARLERFTQTGAIAAASHVISLDDRKDISTTTRLDFYGRRFDVLGFARPFELGVDLVLVCQEIVT